MRPLLLSLSLLLLTSIFALPALAGNWGESWGTMIWGATVAAVPTMGWLGGGLLVGLLASLGMRRIRRRGTGLVLLLALAYAPVAEAQMTEASCALVGGAWDAGTSTCSSIPVSLPHTFADGAVADAAAMNENFEAFSVSVPHNFANGTVANADEVNANFQALKAGVDTCSNNLVFLFAQGDQQACTNVGGTWDAVSGSCTAPPCDDTGNDAAILESVCIQSGGSSYNANSNTCVGLSPTTSVFLAFGEGAQAGCVAAGGSWDTSCIPAPTPESNDPTICESAGGTWETATELCAAAGGAYDSGAKTCSVDITSLAGTPELCMAAGGTYDTGPNTCSLEVDGLSGIEGACIAGPGYSCFIGGFCSQACLNFPPAQYFYTNRYCGHTRTTEPALSAGCSNLKIGQGFQPWDFATGMGLPWSESVSLDVIDRMCSN